MTTYSGQDKERGAEQRAAPVPPCILPVESGGTQISLEIDDRADSPAILKISADHIRIQVWRVPRFFWCFFPAAISNFAMIGVVSCQRLHGPFVLVYVFGDDDTSLAA